MILFAGISLGLAWVKEWNQSNSDSFGENRPGWCWCVETQRTGYYWGAEGDVKSISQGKWWTTSNCFYKKTLASLAGWSQCGRHKVWEWLFSAGDVCVPDWCAHKSSPSEEIRKSKYLSAGSARNELSWASPGSVPGAGAGRCWASSGKSSS